MRCHISVSYPGEGCEIVIIRADGSYHQPAFRRRNASLTDVVLPASGKLAQRIVRRDVSLHSYLEISFDLNS